MPVTQKEPPLDLKAPVAQPVAHKAPGKKAPPATSPCCASPVESCASDDDDDVPLSPQTSSTLSSRYSQVRVVPAPPDFSDKRPRIPSLINTYLRPNATFLGEQQSGISKYHIKVEFKTIDLANSLVTGFLQILGLTEEHPEITTCFKGEIINNPLNRYDWGNHSVNKYNKDAVKKYLFLTENYRWGLYLENDLEHWKKLTGSYDMSESQLKQKLARIQLGIDDPQFVYMRWKEEFLLPDSRVKQISGASFEGFYYIVLNIGGGSSEEDLFSSNVVPGLISGLYYHTISDKFQSLSLRYMHDQGTSNVFEFA